MAYVRKEATYQVGIREITYDNPHYSTSIQRPPISIYKGEYEWREYEYIGVRTGICIIVQEKKENNMIYRYTTTKTPYGWSRCTYVFLEGEGHLFPGVYGWKDGGDDDDPSWR